MHVFTRDWCELEGNYLLLVPSPKPVPIRHLRYPQDAHIVGRVVGFAHLIAPLHSKIVAAPRHQPELRVVVCGPPDWRLPAQLWQELPPSYMRAKRFGKSATSNTRTGGRLPPMPRN